MCLRIKKRKFLWRIRIDIGIKLISILRRMDSTEKGLIIGTNRRTHHKTSKSCATVNCAAWRHHNSDHIYTHPNNIPSIILLFFLFCFLLSNIFIVSCIGGGARCYRFGDLHRDVQVRTNLATAPAITQRRCNVACIDALGPWSPPLYFIRGTFLMI